MLFASLSLSMPSGISASAFLVEGIIEVSFVKEKPKRVEQIIEFRIETDHVSNQWVITDLTAPGRVAYCTDGTTIIDVLSGTDPFLNISAYIQNYPLDLDADQRLLWQVYCAPALLKGPRQWPATLPSGDSRLDAHVSACVADVQWETSADMLPSRVDYFLKHELLRAAITNLQMQFPSKYLNDRAHGLDYLSKVYTNMTRMAIYETVEWVTNQNARVPKLWSLQLLQRGDPLRTYVGRTTKIQSISGVTAPSFPKAAKVTDKRVRSVPLGLNSVTYNVTNGVIPEQSSPTIMMLVGQQSDPRRILIPKDIRWRQRLVGFLIFGLLLLPGLKVLLRRA